MHNYANLCIIMHARDTILFSSLPGVMMKVWVKFRPDPIDGFWEKVERTDVRTNEENYNIDSFTNTYHETLVEVEFTCIHPI